MLGKWFPFFAMWNRAIAGQCMQPQAQASEQQATQSWANSSSEDILFWGSIFQTKRFLEDFWRTLKMLCKCFETC